MWWGGEDVLVRVEPDDVLVVELDHVELPLPPLVELEGWPPEPRVGAAGRDGCGGERWRLGGES